MQMLRRLSFVLAMILFALCTVPAFAQGPGKAKLPAGTEERAYTIPYVATLFTLGLGIAAACMPSHRHWDIEVEKD